jgi:hypothetical protein
MDGDSMVRRRCSCAVSPWSCISPLVHEDADAATDGSGAGVDDLPLHTNEEEDGI